MSAIIKSIDEFEEMATIGIDGRNRVTLGKIVHGASRFKVYRNSQGDILLRPVIEIPASELWLYKNEKALKSVLKGIDDAAAGRVEPLDLDTL